MKNKIVLIILIPLLIIVTTYTAIDTVHTINNIRTPTTLEICEDMSPCKLQSSLRGYIFLDEIYPIPHPSTPLWYDVLGFTLIPIMIYTFTINYIKNGEKLNKKLVTLILIIMAVLVIHGAHLRTLMEMGIIPPAS